MARTTFNAASKAALAPIVPKLEVCNSAAHPGEHDEQYQKRFARASVYAGRRGYGTPGRSTATGGAQSIDVVLSSTPHLLRSLRPPSPITLRGSTPPPSMLSKLHGHAVCRSSPGRAVIPFLPQNPMHRRANRRSPAGSQKRKDDSFAPTILAL